MLKLLLVDDEPLAHQVLLHHLAAHPDMQVVAQSYHAAEALAVLAQQQIDLMLLDIQLPVLTGLEMLKLLAKPPQVIITSAYADYALEGFALDVTDYLLKPISAERLAQALEKVRRNHMVRSAPELPLVNTHNNSGNHLAQTTDFIVLKVDRELRRFQLDTVCCFEAYGNYVKVWQGEQMTLVSSTLKQLCQQLPVTAFVQVHKSFLVAAAHVVSRDSQQLRLSNQRVIKIGEAFKEQARQLLLPGRFAG
ncbi:LytR/AlgR family response regulator transcription factor [Rheinheimera sp. 4Y26]|uniref:LytR/AlgR family response regulator transcription factor n=1 Tax=Rheinheimera sp. 4Y26 TaxID=2977811 RepID=UPI0021B0D16D|nr:LytTR family DNA-binding domain-containing protein [Rheinheimera sp. 4Y26]MCT6700392.1 LytTR family DNA-binding domain-containing protein [Rheinheimera sp. 4Y26]